MQNINRQILYYAMSTAISTAAGAHICTYQLGRNIISGTDSDTVALGVQKF